ncbi:MAG: TetR/AcrR family transcriptional regulator [Treponema sp.]|nr:TetR/AcrR family transcriptional regulator [Treponema sp.]
MGITERKEREKNERRKTILNCARELILLQGVERVSMEDIARKAELSKATLYLYFSGKEVIFNEIGEESARVFLERLQPFSASGLTGIHALKSLWRSYVELFGDSDEMIIIFKVRSFLNPGLPFVSLEGESKSPYVDAILAAMKTIIEQCKAEGVFDPNLDSDMATRLLLSMFSHAVDSAARMPPEARKSPALIMEMAKYFQIIICGFAREGIDRASLDIMGFSG